MRYGDGDEVVRGVDRARDCLEGTEGEGGVGGVGEVGDGFGGEGVAGTAYIDSIYFSLLLHVNICLVGIALGGDSPAKRTTAPALGLLTRDMATVASRVS